MEKPRIFLGSSGQQEKLLKALTRGLESVAHVEPWTTSFNPGTTTLQRLIDLTHEVDFAAFVFASDDWTSESDPAVDPGEHGQSSPRDNVVFEAGLFGSALGLRRTFILHANGAKLPSDLLGLTSVVEEQPRQPDERLPVGGIQLGHGVVRRPLRAAVLAHGRHCHVLLTRKTPERLTRALDSGHEHHQR